MNNKTKLRTIESMTLHLVLKKKWFDMIYAGIKKEEYRSITDHWIRRLISKVGLESEGYNLKDFVSIFRDFAASFPNNINQVAKVFHTATLQLGYAANAPRFTIEFKGIDIGPAKPEWSDNWQGDVFCIKLGEILSTENCTIPVKSTAAIELGLAIPL